jgi:hypothetical protein
MNEENHLDIDLPIVIVSFPFRLHALISLPSVEGVHPINCVITGAAYDSKFFVSLNC